MTSWDLRSLLVAVFVLSNFITWTSSKQLYMHNISDLRNRDKRQGAGRSSSSSYVAHDAVCSLSTDVGPCTNFKLLWYYDHYFGGCSRFWYGGCEGNGNRFSSKQECEDVCIHPNPQEQSKPPKQEQYTTVAQREAIDDKINTKTVTNRKEKKNNRIATITTSPFSNGCAAFKFGWCYDNKSEALGPDKQGCPCNATEFGCCPDGLTIATTHGCCSDGKTAATEANGVGCDCASSIYGCCPDGKTEAIGSNFLGCFDIPENKQTVCSLSTDVGPCTNFKLMWYYDHYFEGCSRFWYGGCEGNGNRFSSKQECEDVCIHPNPQAVCNLPADAGPCRNVKPSIMWFHDLRYGGCSRFWYRGCGGNGNRFISREDCEDVCIQPGPKDACKLPHVKGSCESDIERWYFNTTSEQCLPFRYGGCLGNANNFDTRELCQTQCKPDRTTGCSRFWYGGCEGNGNRFSSKQECEDVCIHPNPQAVCNLPADAGPCRNVKPSIMWFHDLRYGGCSRFWYRGCGGNGNRFISREDCEDVCIQPGPKDACKLPHVKGSCESDIERWYFNTTSEQCLPFRYGGCLGNANNFDTRELCQTQCKPDRTTGCSRFWYGGCEGNGNRFSSKQECEDVCIHPNPQAVCNLPADAGPCRNVKPSIMWFHDLSYGGCSRFWYRGCGGNGNRFISREDCEDVCIQPGPKDACKLPHVKGSCESDIERWYFNTTSEQCLPFRYGGCLGNANNFDTRELCQTQCKPDRTTERSATTKVTTKSESIQPGTRDDKKATLRCLFHRNLPNSVTSVEKMTINSSDSGVYVCVMDSEFGNVTQNINLVVKETINEVIPNCLRKEVECLNLNCEFGIQYYRSDDGCANCTCSTPEPDCKKEKVKCKELTCKYSIEKIVTANGCERCECKADNPCDRDVVTCLDNEQCVVIAESVPLTQEVIYYAECRVVSSTMMEPTTLEPITLQSTTLVDTTTTITTTHSPVSFTVPVYMDLQTTQNTVNIGADLHIVCKVDGYPEPELHWTKDGASIEPDDRISITGTTISKLDISRVLVTDSGRYACHAINSYSSQFLDTEVKVLQIMVPENCTNNSFFANCELIVNSKYCTHKFYSRYCCKSCVEAGQLNPKSPWT